MERHQGPEIHADRTKWTTVARVAHTQRRHLFVQGQARVLAQQLSELRGTCASGELLRQPCHDAAVVRRREVLRAARHEVERPLVRGQQLEHLGALGVKAAARLEQHGQQRADVEVRVRVRPRLGVWGVQARLRGVLPGEEVGATCVRRAGATEQMDVCLCSGLTGTTCRSRTLQNAARR